MRKDLFTTLLFAGYPLFRIAAVAEPNINVNVTASQVKFIKDEPVGIDVELSNEQKTIQCVEMHEDWNETLDIEVIRDGRPVPRINKKKNPGGITATFQERFKPSQRKDLHILLNNSFLLKEEGRCTVSVGIGVSKSETSFTIGPADPAGLKRKLNGIWEEYNNSKTDIEKRVALQKALASNDDPGAVEFQLVMFERRRELSFENLQNLVRVLVSTHSFEVVDFMLKKLGAEKKDATTRAILFYEIKLQGPSTFDEQTRRLLVPYHDEIQQSRPVEISDWSQVPFEKPNQAGSIKSKAPPLKRSN